ncbi:unnamed protein product [Polarella glacialis]|uniref:Uncharacterized protein n=1 Tax=Polarella glacialis TaxID=89957 RepID=A0A813LUY1_POLGL|nr:unnamed protein product [Polarella glacialis]
MTVATQTPPTLVGAVVSSTTEDLAKHGQMGLEGCQAVGVIRATVVSQSLNADPFNVRAEELALQECTVGVEVRRTWSEQQLVRSFGGRISAGTPDGMFESWDGTLTCVQVVRVPLLPDSSVSDMQDRLSQTVLTKVVKSQQWLRFTQASPKDFVIFCWLPYCIPDYVVEHAEVLMTRIQRLDARFSLRLRTPKDAPSLFPALFARNRDAARKRTSSSFTECDVSTFMGSESDTDDAEEYCSWDITWAWDEEPPDIGLENENCNDTDNEDEVEFEWCISWDDNG